MKNFKINTDYITLVQFLKYENYISSGGECRFFIDENEILLDKKEVFEKRKKIYAGSILSINDDIYRIESED